MGFYKATRELDELRKLEVPTAANLYVTQKIIRGDEKLTRYFYEESKHGPLSVGWLELLDGAKEFADLWTKEPSIIARVKALYLVDCASIKPEIVLAIIKKVKAKDPWIRGKMLDAILAMPETLAVQGMPVVLEYLRRRQYEDWFFLGEPAAKFMVKVVERYPKEAFEIARLLLHVWRPAEKEAGVFETIRSKFAAHEYRELLFDYYKKVWEKQPFEATRVLVDIYDKYLDECIKEKNYDVSEYLGVSLQDLEDIRRLEYDLDAIVMKAICEAGREVIKKEPETVTELLEDLEKRNKGVFHRVEMYLLRFVSAGAQKGRINKIIGNQKFIESPLYKYEHRRLLNDKFGEVNEEVKKAFLGWVDKQKITEERRKEVEKWCQKNNKELPDFEKWENQAKAEELYLVRDRFSDLYEGYKNNSGLSDDALAPRRMVSEAHEVSPEEGSPYSSEKMARDNAEIVLDYLLEPKNYEGSEKVSGWGTAKDALAASFKADVKKRPMEYLRQGAEKLENLPAEFLSSLFYAVWDSVRDQSFGKEGWADLIDLAHKVVQAKQKEEQYRNCFSAMLSTLRDGFSERENKIEFDEEKVRKFWEIIEPLVHFPIEDTSRLSEEKDPVQLGCNMVAGQALELMVPLAIVCKRDFEDWWQKYLKEERRKCYHYVLSKIRQPGVNYVFGLDFARIYWSDKEWLEENIENVFCDELWDETWGTYVSWGRPSPNGFKLLVEKRKYDRAVELLGKPNQFKFQKKPEEGLVEHLMIGFFNGWIGLDSDLLKKFFEKGSAELRGQAAHFLTTGFKSVNERGGEEKEKVAERMKKYWGKRLAAMKEKPDENKDEAIEFTGWVEDTLLDAETTLQLLERTLDLSGGRIGKMGDARDFVDGVSKLGKGNELLALRCLKKAAVDENMHMPWADIQEPLVQFLETMVESPENIRREAKEVADLYGRYHPDKFRGVWEKLAGRDS